MGNQERADFFQAQITAHGLEQPLDETLMIAAAKTGPF